MPSTRTAGRVSGAAFTLVVLSLSLSPLVGIAAGQPTGGRSGFDTGMGLVVRFVGSIVVNLLVGGAMLALAPDYVERSLSSIRTDPGEAVVWGLLAAIAVPIALALLAITVIGLIVAIPGAIVLAVVGIVGWALTVLLVGGAATDGDTGGVELLIGAVVLGVIGAIPVIGGMITWLVGLPGIGVVTLGLYRS